ncbi:hypothetical protein ACJX0J_036097, partial [Zea mays]
DFHDSRLGRPFVKPYEQESYGKEDVLSAVEKCMKKYADNLLRSLEGITSRLSQLEIYCYKLERSIGELRSDVLRDETDHRLKSLEKHLNEKMMQVHRKISPAQDILSTLHFKLYNILVFLDKLYVCLIITMHHIIVIQIKIVYNFYYIIVYICLRKLSKLIVRILYRTNYPSLSWAHSIEHHVFIELYIDEYLMHNKN